MVAASTGGQGLSGRGCYTACLLTYSWLLLPTVIACIHARNDMGMRAPCAPARKHKTFTRHTSTFSVSIPAGVFLLHCAEISAVSYLGV